MTKIIDFSNGENSPKATVIQPNFPILSRNVLIEYKEKTEPVFSIAVGCQTSNITADTVNIAISELMGEEKPFVLTKVIVPLGSNPKVSSPKLLDEAGNWLIGSNNKAFSKDQYEVKEINIKDKRKFFSPNKSAWDKNRYPITYRGGYEMSKKDIDNTMSILLKIKDFFENA